MSARHLTPACVALALLAVGCPRRWEYDAVDAAPFAVDDDAWWRMRCTQVALENAGPAWQEARSLHVHCANAVRPEDRALCVTPPNDRGATPIDPWKLRPLASFVHLSDAQIKDPRVHLRGFFGPDWAYDDLQTSARRDELLERHAPAVLQATVAGIDKLVRDASSSQPCEPPCFRPPVAPSFVIHTGDAVDAGMFTELYQFMGALDQAPIPWFDVVGNHDNMYFGTFPEGFSDPDPPPPSPWIPIRTTARFMRYHSPTSSLAAPPLPVPNVHPDHGPTLAPPPTFRSGGSRNHGFDLRCVPRGGSTKACKPEGYYAFELDLPGTRNAFEPGLPPERRLHVIVLHTAETPGWCSGSDGTMTDAQLAWLADELKTADTNGSYVLVFGHHNLASFDSSARAKEVRALLLKHRRVLGYVTGHTHVDDVQVWDRALQIGPPLWEVIGGSTLVYPQLGRVIELMEEEGSGRLFLRVLTMRQALGDRAALLRSARGEAARCDTPHLDVCLRATYRGQSLCQQLADRAFLGRAGAHRDRDNDLREEWEAVTKTNGTMLVFDPKMPKVKMP